MMKDTTKRKKAAGTVHITFIGPDGEQKATPKKNLVYERFWSHLLANLEPWPDSDESSYNKRLSVASAGSVATIAVGSGHLVSNRPLVPVDPGFDFSEDNIWNDLEEEVASAPITRFEPRLGQSVKMAAVISSAEIAAGVKISEVALRTGGGEVVALSTFPAESWPAGRSALIEWEIELV